MPLIVLTASSILSVTSLSTCSGAAPGKRVVIEFEGARFLVIHLMIAGRLNWLTDRAKKGAKSLARFELEHGTLTLTEAGTKRRASIHLVEGEAALAALSDALAAKAGEHPRVVMPGYTHLQRAQVVLLPHVLLSFREAFSRDAARFEIPLVSPLGAGALAGTALPTDPAFTAERLGASAVFRNSIDAVSDRDFAAEFLFAAALALRLLAATSGLTANFSI